MTETKRIVLLALLALAATTTLAAQTPAPRFDVGVRPIVVTAGGEPANDIISFGVFGRYRLTPNVLLGVGIDQAEYDFERPWQVLGLEQDPTVHTIDAPTTSTVFSVWAEREHGHDTSPWRFFWGGGVGFSSPEVDDVEGPLADGGEFALTTDPGTEVIGSIFTGVRRSLGSHFGAEFALRADHHFADWTVTDSVSGTIGSTGNYTGLGGHLGLYFRF